MKLSFNKLRYSVLIDKIIKKYFKKEKNSYSQFCINNKKAKKEDRIKAIKKFLDYTRN